MAITISAESPPFRIERDGAIRVGNSRVLLEIVIRAFQDGATPESIVHRYATLSLGDAYSCIAYYLRHRTEVEQYLIEREQLAEQVKQRIHLQAGDLSGIRDRLLAKQPS